MFRYHQMTDWLRRSFRSVLRHLVPPLKVSISRKLKEVVEEKYKSVGAAKGKGVQPIFVIPHEKLREDVEDVVGYDDSIVFITIPEQLAALINDSAGVIATNTAAIQLAHARGKPSITLFSSAEKARAFMPNAEERKCTVVSSKTGKLVDIDVEAVKSAVQIFQMPLALYYYDYDLLIGFHDEEWGVPVHNDKKLFELLIYSTALAELTWPAILNNRYMFRYQLSHQKQTRKDLVRRGFRGVGPKVVYSFMQVAGITNNHLFLCFRFQDCVTAADASDKDGSLEAKVEDKRHEDSTEFGLVQAIDELSLSAE
ncbi:NDH-dependent cyclic electron flow 1 [Actinidia rufa]|uniref:NDH-dependent cyclic electron flow 1 n=1 Tax=Actinidia rufa TaxID=165716 RepID=A0A7J0H2D4_9ERIC|nr:NDH-dependent cyclic electron flow 1 [Actinidia rufa]